MPKSYKKEWNSRHLSGCVRKAVELLNATGEAVDLLQYAAEHLDCTETGNCRVYRQQLKQRVARLRRVRRIKSWEYWLLSAAEQILHPVPGTKHNAVTMLRSAIDEYDSPLGEPHLGLSASWQEWYEQHVIKEPAYV